jgi:putative transposase
VQVVEALDEEQVGDLLDHRERVGHPARPEGIPDLQDVFEYIEMFYNPKRKHTNNGMLSPVDFEVWQQKLNEAGV